ncbi:hypothetical protein BDZ89DRAFT_952571 [Hymenopellis radicata]|nr:hypothetical protein BDZ89DRAFT_952571 [Hymenopellis radicata]
MASPVIWPGAYYFYPLGNTPAVNLARDVGFDDDAEILLLGCGDPRNILFTILNEPVKSSRKLDFTCCDIDPAVLARNVMLLTMIIDHQYTDAGIIWNSFFHMKIDQTTFAAVIDQSRKLLDISSTIEKWEASSYGGVLKFCTVNTLPDLRRHWQLWVDFEALSPQQRKEMEATFAAGCDAALKRSPGAAPASRAFGPLMAFGLAAAMQSFGLFWTTGTTYTEPKSIKKASHVNPTFLYCLGRKGFHVHYGTDPLSLFHLAPDLAGTADLVTMDLSAIRKSAQSQFSAWCNGYRSALNSQSRRTAPVIRFAATDAIAFGKALGAFHTNRSLETPIPVRQWKATSVTLSCDYLQGDKICPSRFNVIDTSNLNDHIGLWNVLIISAPLLSNRSTPSCVLYTEFLLTGADEDTTKHFTDSLYSDITVLGLLLGLVPVDFVSGFTPHSNVHEALAKSMISMTSSQSHQTMTWKAPTLGDVLTVPTFDHQQLGTYLYGLYGSFFGEEDALVFLRKLHLPRQDKGRILSLSNIAFYDRETFVALLELLQKRLQLSGQKWSSVMDSFFELQDHDAERKMDTVNAQDFYVQLYSHGLHVMDAYRVRLPPKGIFSSWKSVPTAVRVILVVPRTAPGLELLNAKETPTVPLVCDMRGNSMHNIFSSVQVAFGRVTSIGTTSNPRIAFEEDHDGWNGNSSLVASFIMPTHLLIVHDQQSNISVYLSLRNTPGNCMLYASSLGPWLNVFGAKLSDTNHVHVLPLETPAILPPSIPSGSSECAAESIGAVEAWNVVLDEHCECVKSLSAKVSLTNDRIKLLFGAKGATPSIKQTAPCILKLQVSNTFQDLHFPFPVDWARGLIRAARKSLYIEVVVPPTTPISHQGTRVAPFPVIGGTGSRLAPWNIHRVNLDALLPVDLSSKKLYDWLNPHIGAMFSARERKLIKKQRSKSETPEDALALIKDTIHTLLAAASGIQGGSVRNVFILKDDASNNCDTVFFMNGLKYDSSSTTVIADGYVLPLRDALMPNIHAEFEQFLNLSNARHITIYKGERYMWKHILPALVERCRTWSHTEKCEYRSLSRIPLTEEMDSNPLCGCGEGKYVEGMMNNPLWRPFARYATRVAISPLFGVSYLEKMVRDPKCTVCRGKGKLTCGSCKDARYCSKDCQTKDWPRHKRTCKQL